MDWGHIDCGVGISDLGRKWIRLAANGTNLELFQIRFQYILTRWAIFQTRFQYILNRWKNPGFASFESNLTHFRLWFDPSEDNLTHFGQNLIDIAATAVPWVLSSKVEVDRTTDRRQLACVMLCDEWRRSLVVLPVAAHSIFGQFEDELYCILVYVRSRPPFVWFSTGLAYPMGT